MEYFIGLINELSPVLTIGLQ